MADFPLPDTSAVEIFARFRWQAGPDDFASPLLPAEIYFRHFPWEGRGSGEGGRGGAGEDG